MEKKWREQGSADGGRACHAGESPFRRAARFKKVAPSARLRQRVLQHGREGVRIDGLDPVAVEARGPGASGYDLAPVLRASPELEGACLVALSGYDGEEHRRRARAAGFDRHWVKPVDPNALPSMLQDSLT